ncbi:Smr/MutS family protein [Parvularcula lutaonensis]|uniref:Smr/MutS family protein n=1 Tax=Parvularcula lutaonensis TaxID=491923 RepID=A0ABV7M9T5_9PROT|nr:Smr/MutS family protein [Parvularcula lutaonensis]GGY36022.1 DNA mismatch repair protein MutS [Parvularcula lutaonensis]
MSRKKSRQLTDAERTLWNTVARTVAPLPDKKLPELEPKPETPLALSPRKADDGRHATPQPTPPKQSPFQAGDPRRERRVARGRIEIDAVLDLHGMRQSEADRATSAFISRAVSRKHRVLLVITGKGSKDGEEGRGVLRKNFLSGIEMGLYGGAITSVRPAHQRHGGGGAFYVFLKNPKEKHRS